MTYVWLAIGVVVLAVSYYWWPGDKRTLRNVVATAATFAGFFLIANFIVDIWPVTHIEIKEIQKKYVDPPKVIYKDRIVYKAPDGEVAPVDVKGACEGKYPIQIINLDVQTDEKSKETTTWVSGHPVGSKVVVVCGQPGAFNDFWNVGDVIQFVRGVPQ